MVQLVWLAANLNVRLDVLRNSRYSTAYRLNGRDVDTGRLYFIFRSLIREEFGPGHVVPVAHLHRADGLRLFEFLLAMAHVLFYFLRAKKIACVHMRSGRLKW